MIVGGVSFSWADGITPSADVFFRTSLSGETYSWTSGYPKQASETNTEFAGNLGVGMFVLQKYTVENLAAVKELKLTLTGSSGTDALAFWTFTNDWTASTAVGTLASAVNTAVGLDLNTKGTPTNTPLVNGTSSKATVETGITACTFTISGANLTTLKAAATGNTFTLLITNRTSDMVNGSGDRKFYSSGHATESYRPRLEVTYSPARIGSTYYETLTAAVNAAQDNDVITVLTNTESTALDITKAITIKPAADDIVITRASTVSGSAQWLKLGAALTLGDAEHRLILDGGNASASTDMIRTTFNNTSNVISMTNVTIQNYTSTGMVMINSKGKVNMTDVTFKNCSSEGNGILQTEVASGVTFSGTLTFTDCTGNELAQKDGCRFVISKDAKFTAPMKLKLNTEAYGKLALIFNNSGDAATYSRYFIIANEGYGLYQSKNSGTYEFSTTEAYTLTVSQYSASTLVLPYASTLPLGVTAYKLSYTNDDDHVTAIEVDGGTLTANTPVLINAEQGSYKFANTAKVESATTGSGTPTTGALVGTYTNDTQVAEGNYVLYADATHSIGFYKAGDGVTIDANRAYLKSEGGSLARLAIVYGDETNAIEVVKAGIADDAIYTLSGVRVEQPTRGIYVKNGKKFIVK